MSFDPVTGEYQSQYLHSDGHDQQYGIMTSQGLHPCHQTHPHSSDQSTGSVNQSADDSIARPPSIEDLLGLPWGFVLHHVRNNGEASLIIEIGNLGAEMDGLSKIIQEQLADQRTLRRLMYLSSSSPSMMLTSFLTLSKQSLDDIPKKIRMIFYLFQGKMKELDDLANSLTKYMEINNSTAQELKLAGCVELARQKQILANAELVVVKRAQLIIHEHRLPLAQLRVQNEKYQCWDPDEMIDLDELDYSESEDEESDDENRDQRKSTLLDNNISMINTPTTRTIQTTSQTSTSSKPIVWSTESTTRRSMNNCSSIQQEQDQADKSRSNTRTSWTKLFPSPGHPENSSSPASPGLMSQTTALLRSENNNGPCNDRSSPGARLDDLASTTDGRMMDITNVLSSQNESQSESQSESQKSSSIDTSHKYSRSSLLDVDGEGKEKNTPPT